MHARTIDTGATIAELRAFGPPQVVELDDFAGNTSVELGAGRFWTVVQAVHLFVTASANPTVRFPRLSWSAGEQVPFAQVVTPVAVVANLDIDFTLAVGVQAAGTALSGTVVGPMPELVLLPGWTLTVDLPGAPAQDAISGIRAYLQQYKLITVDELIED